MNLQQPRAPPAPRSAASQHSGDSLTTRGSLLGWGMTPRSKNGGPHETHDDHAGVLQTQQLNYSLLGPHRLARRARPQQITTEKGGQAHKQRYRNLSLMRNNKCESNSDPHLEPHCQHQHPEKHEEQPDLQEPKAAQSPVLRKPLPLPEVLQANTVKLNDEVILAKRGA